MYSIVNYDKLLHYKDRNNTFIRLYANVVSDNNYAFAKMSDELKLSYLACLITAINNDGNIESPEKVKFCCYLSFSPDLDSLVEHGLLSKVPDPDSINDKT